MKTKSVRRYLGYALSISLLFACWVLARLKQTLAEVGY